MTHLICRIRRIVSSAFHYGFYPFPTCLSFFFFSFQTLCHFYPLPNSKKPHCVIIAFKATYSFFFIKHQNLKINCLIYFVHLSASSLAFLSASSFSNLAISSCCRRSLSSSSLFLAS